jgi:hypothetical protein
MTLAGIEVEGEISWQGLDEMSWAILEICRAKVSHADRLAVK